MVRMVRTWWPPSAFPSNAGAVGTVGRAPSARRRVSEFPHRTHDATIAKRSPKWIANSMRAACQNVGGARHFRSTPRNAR